MTIISNNIVGLTPPSAFDPLRHKVREPSQAEVAEAAVRLENDVYATWSLLKRKDYADDPNYSLLDDLNENPWIVTKGYQSSFQDVRSKTMFDDVVTRIKQEEADKATIAAAGWDGLAWLIASGVVSPTSFIPLIGPVARGWKAVGQGAISGAAVAGLQEAVLGTSQETRTLSESVWSIGTTTALGGVLGGIVGRMRGAPKFLEEFQKLDRQFAKDTENLPNAQLRSVAPPSSSEARSLGAAMAEPEFTPVKGIAGVFGTDVKGPVWNFMERLGPVGRSYASAIPGVRAFIGQITDAGLTIKPEKAGQAVASEGLITGRIAQWRGPMEEALRTLSEMRLRHLYEGNAPKRFKGTAEAYKRMTGQSKVSRQEFHAEVAKAIYQGEKYNNKIPEAKEAAAAITRLVYEPMLKEAQKIGLFSEDIKTVGDLMYLNRLYNKSAIRQDTAGFIQILTTHFEEKLAQDLAEGRMKLLTSEIKDNELISILEMSDEQVEQLFRQLSDELEQLKISPEQALLHEIDDLRDRARRAKVASPPDTAEYKRLLKAAHDAEEQMGEKVAEVRTRVKEVRRKLRALSQTRARLDEKRAAKMALIDRLESQQVTSMETVIAAHGKLLKGLDKFSDEALDEQLDELTGRLRYAQSRFMRLDEKIWRELRKDDGDMERVLGWSITQDNHLGRIDELIDRVDDLKGLDRMDIEVGLREAYTEVFKRVQDLNNRRALRIEKLWQDALKLDPDRVANKIQDLKTQQAARRVDFTKRLEERTGIEDIDLIGGTRGLHDAASRIASEVTNKILAAHTRVPGLDILGGERGPEIARLLDIPTERLGNFVELDVEKLIRSYVRTMSPDLELFRRFKSVNASSFLGTGAKPGALLEELAERRKTALSVEDKAKAVKEAKAAVKAAIGKDAKEIAEGNLRLIEEAPDSEELNRIYMKAHEDLTAIIGRLRHTWGVPADAEAIGYRLGRQALNLNTLRFMGMVVVSSIPDLARFTMKYGLARTIRNGLVPLITNLKAMKLSMRETKLAGTANDVFLHTRMFELMDLVDEFAVTSKVERGLDFATSKIGIIAGFDYWNAGLKMFAGALSNAQILDSIEQMMKAGGAKVASKHRDYLATLNIDGATAETIWQLVTEAGGGNNVKGVWLPNTEDWLEAAKRVNMTEDMAERARRVYRAAVVREVDSTIITPGVERPLSFDKSIAHRVLFQFKSFGMSSTQMTLMAGLQQRNANFALGTMQALAFGALSYYLWALAAGEDLEQVSTERWIDEAIDRSGMLAVFGFGRDVGSTIPWLNDYVMFSGEQTTRRGGTGLINALMGPTGDLAFTAGRVASDIDEPTKSTIHSFRKLLPLQNVWYIRQIFDALEERAADTFNVPERRQ